LNHGLCWQVSKTGVNILGEAHLTEPWVSAVGAVALVNLIHTDPSLVHS